MRHLIAAARHPEQARPGCVVDMRKPIHIDQLARIDMPFRRLFRRRPVSGVEARQGFLDRPVLAVLVVSLALAAVALGLLLIGFV
jgi:hypothetical protein